MNYIEDIKNFLRNKPGYLKKGAQVLANRLNASLDNCAQAIQEIKNELTNNNVNSHFNDYLQDNNIDPNSVESVKFWQTQKGEIRYSIVSKNKAKVDSDNIKNDIADFAAALSTDKPVKYLKSNILPPEQIAYEISLPDLHYGKITNLDVNELNTLYLRVIKDLVSKASGLNIEKFILPIGNDGMNSEGMRQSTTKGTPQHDSMSWKETFRGYWKLIVIAIDYLKQIAPVDVIVISGNHDYERMYYAGDVISGWYRNNPNVTVDNSNDPRKYYEYGQNMLMFTHGDNEKAQDIPLIMATEQPEMFARTSHHEAHCGHFHKEQVNEYRGIKIRFIPSICPNDEWHKKMGYDAKRVGQAYIWNKKRGLEGYLQSNV
jgi:hypothetical protein